LLRLLLRVLLLVLRHLLLLPVLLPVPLLLAVVLWVLRLLVLVVDRHLCVSYLRILHRLHHATPLPLAHTARAMLRCCALCTLPGSLLPPARLQLLLLLLLLLLTSLLPHLGHHLLHDALILLTIVQLVHAVRHLLLLRRAVAATGRLRHLLHSPLLHGQQLLVLVLEMRWWDRVLLRGRGGGRASAREVAGLRR
jgi:hypothetical protein